MPSGRLSRTRLEGNVVKQVPECSLNMWEYLKNQQITVTRMDRMAFLFTPSVYFIFLILQKFPLLLSTLYTVITDGYVYGYNIIYECLATFKLFPIFQY